MGVSWVRIAFLLIVLAVPAYAQTGGRAGGGSWSNSSSPSSSSSSYQPSSTYTPSPRTSYAPPSSTASDTTSTSYDTSHHGGGGGGGGGLTAVAIFALAAGSVIVFVLRNGNAGTGSYRGFSGYSGYTVPEVAGVDVCVLRVALDGRARKFVQRELARIAKIADTATEEGRLLLLREVSLMLRKVRDAWVYGGAVNEPMRSLAAAKVCFDRHVDEARVKIAVETVSNVDGVLHLQDAPGSTPRSDQGEGVILVSIIVATRSELFDVRHIGDGETLRKAVEVVSHRTASDLVAVDIVWMPAEEDDRMSSIELEAKYPHPSLIRITGALVGKVFCAYCSGPFPAELVTCPHCGAPAPGHDQTMPRAA
ncbi:MAG: DUF1517 domain-containing protein [Deltaproteobacteria bacterium]|nr:DUF1517 domain-containing protein [Deltaproteobacteria bacterium]